MPPPSPGPLPPVCRLVYVLSQYPQDIETTFPSSGCETPFQTRASEHFHRLPKHNVVTYKKNFVCLRLHADAIYHQ